MSNSSNQTEGNYYGNIHGSFIYFLINKVSLQKLDKDRSASWSTYIFMGTQRKNSEIGIMFSESATQLGTDANITIHSGAS